MQFKIIDGACKLPQMFFTSTAVNEIVLCSLSYHSIELDTLVDVNPSLNDSEKKNKKHKYT